MEKWQISVIGKVGNAWIYLEVSLSVFVTKVGNEKKKEEKRDEMDVKQMETN